MKQKLFDKVGSDLKKRKYYRKCPVCGERLEQKEMIRSNEYDGGWVCRDCYFYTQDEHIEYFIEEW